MKLTLDNLKEFASNVMTKDDVKGYNRINGTKYEALEDLLEGESDEYLFEFYGPSVKAGNED